MKINFLTIILLTFINVCNAQISTIPYSWGWTDGKLTRTMKIINEKRVLDGPFSYNGTDKSPSTLIIKGNYKSELLHGSFSANWVCPSRDGFLFSANGNFFNDSLDGVWNFQVKGKNEAVPFHRKLTLTFKRGHLIQGKINDLLDNSFDSFTCDEFGYFNGNQISKELENGYMIENLQKYVHGVPTIESKKDLASGAYLDKPSMINDTAIVNNKNFNASLLGFKKGGDFYALVEGDSYYQNIFTNRSYLGSFLDKGNYGSEFVPFIKLDHIILPKDMSIEKKEQAVKTNQQSETVNSGETKVVAANPNPYILGNTKIKITTSVGTIILKLYDSTPKHRDNFVKLVEAGFYDSLLFHRVIQGFMIQGGDPMSKNAQSGTMLGMGGGDMERIPAEFNKNIIHKKGALCAARDGNPTKASSACQFYIVQGNVSNEGDLFNMEQSKGITYSAEQKNQYKTVGGTPFLDMDYTVFGETISGLEVIDKIAAMKTDGNNRPLVNVIMKMEIVK